MTKLTPKRDWKAYYDAVANRQPRKTILTALAAFETPGMAIDLGCGDGRDTIEILRQNWTLLAIDKEPEAIARLLERSSDYSRQLTTQITSFEELKLPKSVDLINASFSLPFCSPQAFPSLWNQIFNARDRFAFNNTVIPMGVGSIIGAILGGMLVGIINARLLKLILGVILIISAFKVFHSLKKHDRF
jgi:SAM-dependent methyltransferase